MSEPQAINGPCTGEGQMGYDAVFIEPDSIRSQFTAIPREPASDPAFIKHVYCEGARFHVLSWDTLGERCSEPRCIKNKRRLSENVTNAGNATRASIPKSSSSEGTNQ